MSDVAIMFVFILMMVIIFNALKHVLTINVNYNNNANIRKRSINITIN